MKKINLFLALLMTLSLSACSSMVDGNQAGTTTYHKNFEYEEKIGSFEITSDTYVNGDNPLVYMDSTSEQEITIEYLLDKKYGDMKIILIDLDGNNITLIDTTKDNLEGEISVPLEIGMNVLGVSGTDAEYALTIKAYNYDDSLFEYLGVRSPEQSDNAPKNNIDDDITDDESINDDIMNDSSKDENTSDSSSDYQGIYFNNYICAVTKDGFDFHGDVIIEDLDEKGIIYMDVATEEEFDLEYLLEKKYGDVKIVLFDPNGNQTTLIDTTKDNLEGEISVSLEIGMNVLGVSGIDAEYSLTLIGKNYDNPLDGIESGAQRWGSNKDTI